jgi:tyrosine-protein kinase Etk/Wzc
MDVHRHVEHERRTAPSSDSRAGRSYALEDDEGEFHIGDFIAIFMDYKWMVLLVTATAVLLGGMKAFLTQPIYRTDALLQVEEKARGLSMLEGLQPMLDDASSISGELELLRSRMILGQVVDKLKLDMQAAPQYLPVMGAAIARRYTGEGVAQPWFNMAEYAWGGEKIRTESLLVPEAMMGKTILLIAGESGRFNIIDPLDGKSLEGEVGSRVEREYPNGQRLAVFVSYLKARPGALFSLRRIPRADAISKLRGSFSIAEKSRGSGMLEASLTGADPALIRRTLDQIITEYVRQNVERRSAEAEQTLSFLESQLPALKERLEAAEAAYNSYRLEKGSVDLTSETQTVLKSMVELDNGLVELQQKRVDLRQRFTAEHPQIVAIDANLARIEQRRNKLDQAVERLPDTQQKVLRLSRDVEVNNNLYTALLNSAQELRVAKAGTVGNARIIDRALASRQPIKPNKARIVAISLVLGLLLSFLLVWARVRLRNGVQNPEEIERQLGVPVYASIPHSKHEAKLAKALSKSHWAAEGVLAFSFPEEEAVEGLKSLRTALHFTLMDAPNNIVLITGPKQGIGKSFISRNYAAVLVQAGSRVALVDADLRKGKLHRQLALDRGVGVTEFVRGDADFRSVVKNTVYDNFHVVTTGARPPNPSELLMHKNFEALLKRLSETHDYVIVDAPPVLAVSDAINIGRFTGSSFLVAKAGEHPIQELSQTLKAMKQGGVKVGGFILNDVDIFSNRYRYGSRYGYGRYVYQYSYKN